MKRMWAEEGLPKGKKFLHSIYIQSARFRIYALLPSDKEQFTKNTLAEFLASNSFSIPCSGGRIVGNAVQPVLCIAKSNNTRYEIKYQDGTGFGVEILNVSDISEFTDSVIEF